MPKFFISCQDIVDNTARMYGDNFHHVVRVLRMKEGDGLLLADGEGYDYDAVIKKIDVAEILADIIQKYCSDYESKVKITLYQSLPKQGKMEGIVQRATELGVHRIVPVQSARSVMRFDASSGRLERWRRVAEAAAKQCGRALIPTIDSAMSFDDMLKDIVKLQYKIMPYELETKKRFSQVLAEDMHEVGIIVGAEGGFEAAEVAQAAQCGVDIVTLGRRILRTETVATALIPLILQKAGEI